MHVRFPTPVSLMRCFSSNSVHSTCKSFCTLRLADTLLTLLHWKRLLVCTVTPAAFQLDHMHTTCVGEVARHLRRFSLKVPSRFFTTGIKLYVK